jgi:hypothetical protein
VSDNGVVDILFGSTGMDWFFAHQHGSNQDIISNWTPGEVITPI